MAKAGDVIFVPRAAPHRFVAGKNGGHSLVISPPELEFYFYKVSELLRAFEIWHNTQAPYDIMKRSILGGF